MLVVGAQALWPQDCAGLAAGLPPEVRQRMRLAADPYAEPFDAVLHHGPADSLAAACAAVARATPAVAPVTGLAPGEAGIPLERLVVERATSTNTAAAGGNASLMTIEA